MHWAIGLSFAAALLVSSLVLLIVYLRREPVTCDCDLCMEMRNEPWHFDDISLCGCERCQEYAVHLNDLLVGRREKSKELPCGCIGMCKDSRIDHHLTNYRAALHE